MEFIKSLMEDSNYDYLQELSVIAYPDLDPDTDTDSEEKRDELRAQREKFIHMYHKKNNRQFILVPTSRGKLHEYKKQVLAYESRYDLDDPFKS